MEDMQAAITALRGRPEVQGAKVGVLGFCLGGKLAYLAACRTDADVAVGYYGVGIDAALDEADQHQAAGSPCTWPSSTSFCPPEARDRIVAALQRPARASRCMCTPASTTPSRAWAASTSTSPRR